MSRVLAVVASLCVSASVFAAPVSPPLRIAAASDLTTAFKEIGEALTKKSGQKVELVFAASGLLAKQLEEGAPFDVFAAANVAFVDDTIKAGVCLADTRSLYARGRIAVWTQKGSVAPKSLAELTDGRFKHIAIANPDHAPYGKAALQAITKAGLVDKLKPRLVYGENVRQTLQFAQSGNAEAAIVALSLAKTATDGSYLEIAEDLHAPIEQAMVVCGKDPARLAAARAFAAFVLSPEGHAILERNGLHPTGPTAGK